MLPACRYIHTWLSFRNDAQKCEHCGMTGTAFSKSTKTETITRQATVTPVNPNKLDRKMWKRTEKQKEHEARQAARAAKYTLDDLDLEGFNPVIITPEVDTDPSKLTCSFCNKEVEHVDATFGKGIPNVKVDLETEGLSDNPYAEPTVVQKVRVSSTKVTACPKCCLKLSASVDKDGKVTNHIATVSRV